MSALSNLAKDSDSVTRCIRFVVRRVPPRGRGIALAHAWTGATLRTTDSLSRQSPAAPGCVVISVTSFHASCSTGGGLIRAWWTGSGGGSARGDVYVDVGAHIGYLSALEH